MSKSHPLDIRNKDPIFNLARQHELINDIFKPESQCISDQINIKLWEFYEEKKSNEEATALRSSL